MNVKPILGAAVGMQSIAILGRATQMADGNWFKKSKKKKKSNYVRGFFDVYTGTVLLKPTAEIVGTI